MKSGLGYSRWPEKDELSSTTHIPLFVTILSVWALGCKQPLGYVPGMDKIFIMMSASMFHDP